MALPATPRPIELVSIVLDKPRTLRLDFNALRRAETINKRNYMKGESWQDLSISDMTVLVWAGLLHEDPKLTLDAVGAEIHGGNLEYVGACLMQAQSASSPGPDEGATAADPLPPNVTRLRGSISGPSDATT